MPYLTTIKKSFFKLDLKKDTKSCIYDHGINAQENLSKTKPLCTFISDIDECLTGTDDCNHESQICLNTKGNFTCLDKVSKKSCPPGFKKNIYTQNCEDINECEENDDACRPDEECVNEAGGHNCLVRPKIHPLLTPQHSTTTVRPTEATTPTRPLFASGPPSVHCPNGYEYSSTSGRCQGKCVYLFVLEYYILKYCLQTLMSVLMLTTHVMPMNCATTHPEAIYAIARRDLPRTHKLGIVKVGKTRWY